MLLALAGVATTDSALQPASGKTERTLYVQHIPKTGMMSLCMEMKASGDLPEHTDCAGGKRYEDTHSQAAEACLGMTRQAAAKGGRPSPLVSTMVCEPREHVLSQYMECAYGMQRSVWRKGLAWESDGGVPGASVPSGFSEANFSRWLSHYTDWKDNAPAEWTKKNDYECYTPWNLQSRAIKCEGVGAFEGGSNHAASKEDLHLWVDDELAPTAVDHVGTTEMYDESWCLLRYQLDGALPSDCTCLAMGRSSSPTSQGKPGARHLAAMQRRRLALWHGGGVHETHQLPERPRARELSASTIEQLDALTAQDQKLYSKATVRLLRDLCKVQAQTGRRLLCSKRLRELKEATQHIANLSKAIDEAAYGDDCKVEVLGDAMVL